MPVSGHQSSAGASFAAIGRSFLSLRRDQLPSTSSEPSSNSFSDLDSFETHVADLFQDLSSAPDSDLLSLPWLRKLLDTFLICQEEFRATLLSTTSYSSSSRLVPDFFDRAVKALDVCNAVRDGVDQIRHWAEHLEIAVVALTPQNSQRHVIGEGQFRRAKKALAEFAIATLTEKEAGPAAAVAWRNRSFGRNGGGSSSRDHHHQQQLRQSGGHFRSLSWSVSRSWSASKQLQAIGSNLSAPRTAEIAATEGLAVPVYTMSSVLLFVMWVLVAAIPCQDRGTLQAAVPVPRSCFPWAAPVASLYERVGEEWKRKRSSGGLLREACKMEGCARRLAEAVEEVPAGEEGVAEVQAALEEMAEVCGALKEGLGPLGRQVREVFQRIVRSRTEGLSKLGGQLGS